MYFESHGFDKKILLHASAEKGDKKTEEFQISYFYWLFLSDVMAVKGLTILLLSYLGLTFRCS